MSRGRPAPDQSNVAGRVTQDPSAARPFRDLCSTCTHAETCGNPSTPERPIFFCELFEVFSPARVVTAPAGREPAGRRDAGEYKGLCLNCENRNTCTMPRPEGGIWHCEEYQ